MKNFNYAFQGVDSRHGVVGAELYLTPTLCDSRHTLSDSGPGVYTSHSGSILMKYHQASGCHSQSNHTKTKKRN